MEQYVIGLDYGTDSVRALIVNSKNGEELASAVHNYSRWQAGKYCNPATNQFRQHPLDYLEGLETVIREALTKSPPGTADAIKGISVDTTGSTPIAVDENGNALALLEGFKDNPNAMFVLWKDHTAIQEAAEINDHARNWGGTDYTKYCGGIYSSEWFWAKILHILREDDSVAQAAFSWVEHCDWIPAMLTGNNNPLTLKRSRCAAGHKAMWHEEFGGLPSEKFLTGLDPLLSGLRERLYTQTFTSDKIVGTLSPEWSDKLGLNSDVIITVGAFDAHMGAVGGEIVPGALSKVMGTSTCDMLIAPTEEVGNRLIRGICGQVDGSIIPGMLGMEAGQSAFGDLYAWFRKLLVGPTAELISRSQLLDPESGRKLIDELSEKMLPLLSEQAAKLDIKANRITALDWINGRRTPDANQSLKCAISGLSMGSDAAAIFKSLVEATAFGAKKIVDRFQEEGVAIHEVIALGGVAKKSSYVMQTVADVLNMEIKVARSEQACALGAAMFAAVAAGIHPDIREAQKAMGSGVEKSYKPIPANNAEYEILYREYSKLAQYIESETSDKDLD